MLDRRRRRFRVLAGVCGSKSYFKSGSGYWSHWYEGLIVHMDFGYMMRVFTDMYFLLFLLTISVLTIYVSVLRFNAMHLISSFITTIQI